MWLLCFGFLEAQWSLNRFSHEGIFFSSFFSIFLPYVMIFWSGEYWGHWNYKKNHHLWQKYWKKGEIYSSCAWWLCSTLCHPFLWLISSTPGTITTYIVIPKKERCLLRKIMLNVHSLVIYTFINFFLKDILNKTQAK